MCQQVCPRLVGGTPPGRISATDGPPPNRSATDARRGRSAPLDHTPAGPSGYLTRRDSASRETHDIDGTVDVDMYRTCASGYAPVPVVRLPRRGRRGPADSAAPERSSSCGPPAGTRPA